jgi:hypothetical protein
VFCAPSLNVYKASPFTGFSIPSASYSVFWLPPSHCVWSPVKSHTNIDQSTTYVYSIRVTVQYLIRTVKKLPGGFF